MKKTRGQKEISSSGRRREIPRIGLIGGSGLYSLPDLRITEERRLNTPFGTPSDTFFLGEISGVPVAFLARHGRHHRLLPSEINYRANVWGFRKLGCSWLISASACGSMKEAYRPTEIVLPDQFLDLTKRRVSTFFGDGCVGHVSFSHPVSETLLDALEAAGKDENAVVHRGGTYVCMEGPQFSTQAESLLYRSWGVDVIGMTNATEAKLCREAGIAYASACLVTDYDCWHEEEGPVSVEAVLSVLKANAATANRVLAAAVRRLDPSRPSDCADALAFAILTPPTRVPVRTRRRLALFTQKGRA
ncbi:MAG TPA: S-methyl-5'-thioadenosine phosphorylase [Thermoanaerobaculia bacterium]|nr:S-methyl-5'-thioadenosine phosphorylase [Thermoanaerobaculia bacterium]